MAMSNAEHQQRYREKGKSAIGILSDATHIIDTGGNVRRVWFNKRTNTFEAAADDTPVMPVHGGAAEDLW